MEDIIKQIWKDAEKFGWETIKGNISYYLGLCQYFHLNPKQTAQIKKKLEEIDTSIAISGGEDHSHVEHFIYTCPVCGTSYTHQELLLWHKEFTHKNKSRC